MTDFYLTHAGFLFITYDWTFGPRRRFPNAKLFQVPDPPTELSDKCMKFYFCRECEAAYELWRTSEDQ